MPKNDVFQHHAAFAIPSTLAFRDHVCSKLLIEATSLSLLAEFVTLLKKCSSNLSETTECICTRQMKKLLLKI